VQIHVSLRSDKPFLDIQTDHQLAPKNPQAGSNFEERENELLPFFNNNPSIHYSTTPPLHHPHLQSPIR